MKLGSSPGSMKKARQGLAATCLFVFLGLYALAAFPALHAWVHHDASDPAHKCPVTCFSHGQVHGASTASEIREPALFCVFREAAPAALFVSSDVRLLPSRGPPQGLLFL